MTSNLILLPIVIPLIAGLLTLPIRRLAGLRNIIALVGTILNLIVAIILFKHEFIYSLPWAGFGMEFILRLYNFSAFILLATAVFAFLFILYCSSFMRDRNYRKPVLCLFAVFHRDGQWRGFGR